MLQFVRWRENLPSLESPLDLPGQGAVCNYLTDLIHIAATLYSPCTATAREPVNLEGYAARLHFTASRSIIDESFFDYADLVAHYFNAFLHNLWKEEVDRWTTVACLYSPGTDRKDAIADLHRHSGIEYYRELDADIRANHRFRDYRHLVAKRRATK